MLANVPYGSLADIGQPIRDVRFDPGAGQIKNVSCALLFRAVSGLCILARRYDIHWDRRGVAPIPALQAGSLVALSHRCQWLIGR
jgi:hypothetical protein